MALRYHLLRDFTPNRSMFPSAEQRRSAYEKATRFLESNRKHYPKLKFEQQGFKVYRVESEVTAY